METRFHPLLKGAIELHCHSSPSIFPRAQTDWELVEDVKASGMAGVVLKAHEASTVNQASLIRLQAPSVHVYGGLVCNHFTGGLSPQAVDTAIGLGAKIIWMPTISAKQHRRYFANRKTRVLKSTHPVRAPGHGLEIWDAQRRILPEVHEILALIADADIILGTGHLSPEETVALVDAANEHNVHKILVQHTDLGIARIPFEMEKALIKKGAILEKCYLACSEDFNDITVAEMAASIRRLGAEGCVLVTDYGQRHNKPPIHAFSRFVHEIMSHGISSQEVETMIVHNPRQLLGID